MTTEEALQVLLQPVYERYGIAGETLEQFTDLFLNAGGKIQIELPAALQERMSNESEEVPIENSVEGTPKFRY